MLLELNLPIIYPFQCISSSCYKSNISIAIVIIYWFFRKIFYSANLVEFTKYLDANISFYHIFLRSGGEPKGGRKSVKPT